MHEIAGPVREAIEAVDIPSLPQVLLRLVNLVSRDDVSARDICELVEKDPALAARILTAANSAAVRRGRALTTLSECLMALGTRVVRSMATCLAVRQVFDRRSGKAACDATDFWVHSLSTAELARSIAETVNYPRPEEAYLAGLLHDIGQLVLVSALPDAYLPLLAAGTNEDQLAELEHTRLQSTHGDVGAWMVDRWHLDSSLGDAIMYHHATPDQIGNADALCQIVWTANRCTNHPAEATEKILAGVPNLGIDSAAALVSLRDEAIERTRTVAESIDVKFPDPASDPISTGLLAVDPALAARIPQPASSDEQLQAYVGSMAALAPLYGDLLALDNEEDLFVAIWESARILFGVGNAGFLLHNPVTAQLQGIMDPAYPAVFRHVRLADRQRSCLAAEAFIDGEIRSSFDPSGWQGGSLLDSQFTRALESEGLLCLPLADGSHRIGVMVVGVGAEQYSKLLTRLPWLQHFGAIAGSALATFRNTRARSKELRETLTAEFIRHGRRIGHEAGNPLGVIKTYLRLLESRLPADAGVQGELDIVREEIDRVGTIIRQIAEPPQIESADGCVDPKKLIESLLELYREPLFTSRSIRLDVDLEDASPPIACEPDGLRQILVNLWKNASEALGKSGHICIATRARVIRKGQPYFQIIVRDNGPGLGDDAMIRLSAGVPGDPSAPRGLGLSIVSSLVERMGIELAYHCPDQGGTEFTLTIRRL